MRTAQSKLTTFTLSLMKSLPLHPSKLMRQYSDSKSSSTPPSNSSSGTKPAAPPNKPGCDKPKKTYETPRPPKDPPDDYCPMEFCHDAFAPPEMLPLSVFRQFSSNKEQLGPCAHKCAEYKNPEYFSYHRFSFVGIQEQTLEVRKQQASLSCVYDYESGYEDDNSTGSDCMSSDSASSDSTGSDSTGSDSTGSGTSSDDSDVDCKRELR